MYFFMAEKEKKILRGGDDGGERVDDSSFANAYNYTCYNAIVHFIFSL